MKTKASLLFVLVFSVLLKAQTADLTGSWLMTKAEVGNKIQEPYFITDLTKDGKIIVMGIDFGTWKYDKAKNIIIATSKIDKDFNGTYSVLKLTANELTLKKDSVTSYYTKVDTAKIAEANKNSKLQGIWKIKNDENLLQILELKLPDSYSFTEADDNSTETTNGSWIYLPAEKSLIIMGFTRQLKGKIKVVSVTDNKVIFERNGKKIIGEKKKDNNKIERLTFEEEDFPEREYVEAGEFPWIDLYQMAESLENVKELVFRYGKLLPQINTFKYSTIISKVKVDLEKPSVNFTNFNVNNGDTSQYSEKHKGGLMEMYNYFFPQEEISPYKKVGVETITVPAGTFECSVFEGFDGFDKVKYWMINDKPGIYAKIIREQIDPFDKLEYSIKELVEIKLR